MAVVPVMIRRDPKNLKGCIVEPRKFEANLDDTVRFVHTGLPTVTITFRNGTPFDEVSFSSGQASHTVKKKGTFAYDVTWDEPDGKPGNGDGTGVVPPG
jgi:plastocyanin